MRLLVVRAAAAPYNILRISPFMNIGGTPPAFPAAERFSLQCLPDTAWQQRSRPLFVPDYAPEGLAVELGLAVRVSRLGRSVAERFASRYYDAATVCAAACASGLAATLRDIAQPTDIACGFDAAANGGTWEAVPPAGTPLRLVFSGGCEGAVEASAPSSEIIGAALSFVSRHVKLCQGDVLLLPLASAALRAVEDTHIDGYFDTRRVLSFNVK